MDNSGVVRLKPFQYIHVLDNNSNVTRVEVGPQTFTRQEHEKVLTAPEPMVMIPPRHYCVVQNPVARKKPDDATSAPVVDQHGNVKLRHGDEELRFEQEPFPLYPGEKILGKVTALQVVAPNAALRLRCIRDFVDAQADNKACAAGDEWQFRGPGTYIPRVEVQVVEIINAHIVKRQQALRIRARKATSDASGAPRKAGEEWLVRENGAYLPGVDEEVVENVAGYILTDKKALHLRAVRTFTDVEGVQRKAGEEWLVTNVRRHVHIPDVYEEVVGEVKINTLSNRQYCVVLDPLGADGKPQFGQRKVIRGEASFFLHPGERLQAGIQNVWVLNEDEALLLRAREDYTSPAGEKHAPGDRWMVRGPTEYVPPVEVEIVEKRRAIPLDTTEGIYVRNMKTGKVSAIIGRTYMLSPEEELWSKELPKVVEDLLAKERQSDAPRDKTRVVTYQAPHNTAVQIYDYKKKKAATQAGDTAAAKASRIVFGPASVMLEPDEYFTVLSLSGDKPKRPHVIKALSLQLGPEFMTDIVTVETSDHARLSLKLSYNWQFDVTRASAEVEKEKLFQVPDFIGDACKAIAARVRGVVAATAFDSFHKSSAKVIRSAVFGTEIVDGKEKVNDFFKFAANNLVVTNIDIQSVEPVDQRTRDSLQKSVQLAIEITTKSQEAEAKHDAQAKEQEAKGRLERQKILDESMAEEERRKLLELQAASATVEATGQALADAKARSMAAAIEGEAAVTQAQLRAQANKISAQVNLMIQQQRQNVQIEHESSTVNAELTKAAELAEIESGKFAQIVDAIGKDTITTMARAGPELQAKLLKGLGLKSFMVTDGNSPINLFNMAKGLVDAENAGSA